MKVSEPYQYVRTYIGAAIPGATFANFPDVVQWDNETLLKKDNFHATICCGEDIFTAAGVELAEGEKKLLALFNSFVEHTPITPISFSNDFRYAVDEKRDRKAIVIRLTLFHLKEFFIELNNSFGIDFPVQPAHVTLYTLQKNIGIHIPSDEVMESLPKVSLPLLDEALKGLHI